MSSSEPETIEEVQEDIILPKFKYELYSKPQTFNGSTIYKTYFKILSMEDHMKIDHLLINKGRCTYQHFWGNSNLGYGSSVEYFIHCPKDNIVQIEVFLADGRFVVINF